MSDKPVQIKNLQRLRHAYLTCTPEVYKELLRTAPLCERVAYELTERYRLAWLRANGFNV